MIITPLHIKTVAPMCRKVDAIVSVLNKRLDEFEINTKFRLAHFLAQYAVETADFNALVENTNYTTPERLVAIFPKYFYLTVPVLKKKSAKEYAGKPQAIANYVYGNRMGNGPESSGDGYKFRGAGFCHLTGRSNYTFFQKDMGKYFAHSVVDHPEQLQEIEGGALAGFWYWKQANINAAADKNDNTLVTKLVNGGTNGISDRNNKLTRILKVL